MKETHILHPVLTPFAHIPLGHKLSIISFWIIIIVCIWLNAPVMLPTPSAVGTQLIDLFSTPDFYGDLTSSLWLTIRAMFLSILIASILSYLYPIGLFKWLIEKLVKIRYMSLMGFFFAFMIMFTQGSTIKTVFLMFGIIPFFTLSLISVINRIRQCEYDLWTTLGFSKWEQIYEIIIRGKLDYLFEAVRANFAMGWLMITMVESFSMADGGLGVLLFKFNKYNQLDKIFALQIIIFCLGMGFDYILQQARYLCFPYVALTEKK